VTSRDGVENKQKIVYHSRPPHSIAIVAFITFNDHADCCSSRSAEPTAAAAASTSYYFRCG
jgi:hypothetical protein